MWQAITNANAWDDALRTLPSPHVLQSWAWGEFKRRWGWSAERWLLTDDAQRPRAAVQLLRRNMSRLPVCALYAAKGPAAIDLNAYADALAFIEKRARQQRAIWVKVDGDLPDFLCMNGDGTLPADGTLPKLRDVLNKRGWRFSTSQIQFRNTGLSPLSSDDAMLAAMKPKTRYNLRLAEKRGVTVRVVSPVDGDDAALFYRMYAETSARDGFGIREAAYYVDAWRAMNAIGFVAEKDCEPLAGIVLFTFAGRAWYFYGMSRNEGREHMPNHLLQWTAMRWARDHGCTNYDWWGAPEHEDDEADGMAGVWRFKLGFGARFAEGTGAWDFAPMPWLYAVYVRYGSKIIRAGLAG